MSLSCFMVSLASDDMEATAMGRIRFTDFQTRPTELLDLTSLVLNGCPKR